MARDTVAGVASAGLPAMNPDSPLSPRETCYPIYPIYPMTMEMSET
jgi:hypothetical protein